MLYAIIPKILSCRPRRNGCRIPGPRSRCWQRLRICTGHLQQLQPWRLRQSHLQQPLRRIIQNSTIFPLPQSNLRHCEDSSIYSVMSSYRVAVACGGGLERRSLRIMWTPVSDFDQWFQETDSNHGFGLYFCSSKSRGFAKSSEEKFVRGFPHRTGKFSMSAPRRITHRARVVRCP